MGYDLDLISSQLEHFSAERLAALRAEWADDEVMTRLISEAQELYHGITPSNQFRPSSAQLEALGFPLAYQLTPHRIGLYQVTDRAEGEATRMILWWVGTDQYQLRRRPTAQAQWSTVHPRWSTEEDFTAIFTRFFS